MPIRNFEKRLRFPRLGKIHLGIKKVNERGVEYPAAVDYFVCDDAEFQEAYPGQPKELDILFPVDDEEVIASHYYRAYSRTRGLVCKGDGVSCDRLIDADTGSTEIVGPKVQNTARVPNLPCPGENCPYLLNKTCKQLMMIQFLLPKVRGLGVWQLDTSSFNSTRNILSMLRLIKAGNQGHVLFVPLKLRVVPQEVTVEGRKKTVHVLELGFEGYLTDLRRLTALPPPDDEEIPELLYGADEEVTYTTADTQVEVAPAPAPVEAKIKTAPPTGKGAARQPSKPLCPICGVKAGKQGARWRCPTHGFLDEIVTAEDLAPRAPELFDNDAEVAHVIDLLQKAEGPFSWQRAMDVARQMGISEYVLVQDEAEAAKARLQALGVWGE